MKGNSRYYKYNLITQEKGFWEAYFFGELALAYLAWHKREDHSLEKQEVTQCSTLRASVSLL